MYEEDRAEEIYINSLQAGYWRTKKGNYVHVGKMTDWHLNAVDHLLIRVGDPYRFRSKIRQEQARRKDEIKRRKMGGVK